MKTNGYAVLTLEGGGERGDDDEEEDSEAGGELTLSLSCLGNDEF